MYYLIYPGWARNIQPRPGLPEKSDLGPQKLNRRVFSVMLNQDPNGQPEPGLPEMSNLGSKRLSLACITLYTQVGPK